MRQLFIVAAKLLGIIQLYWSFVALAQIGFSIEMLIAESKPEVHSMIRWGLAGFGAYFLLTVGLAWILLARTDWLADMLGITNDTKPSVVSETLLLSTGIRLVGLYVAVMAAPATIKTLLNLQGLTHKMGFSSWADVIPSGLELCLGCILAFKADTVMHYIAGRNEIHE